MTGRGGVLVVFAACLAGLLIAHWANWGELADAVFFMASSLTAYYVRPRGLLPVVASAPLLFLMACAITSAVTSSGVDGTLTMLAGAAWWMIAGMVLTVAVALLRGLRGEVYALWAELRGR